jgi:CheY-like chemotaxis protein
MAHICKTILIAEDSDDEVFLLKRVFAKTCLPWKLHVVPNGQEAIDYLSRKPPYNDDAVFPLPSVVILDLKMPVMGGFEVLDWLNLQPVLNELPVIIHTSSDQESDRARAMALGASAYFVKSPLPSELQAMFDAVAEKYLGRRRPVQALVAPKAPSSVVPEGRPPTSGI